MGPAMSNFFGPAPWGPGEGSKGQISFNFNYKVNFNDLCVFSQMKDTKHSAGIFILSPESCPRGGTLGHWGCPRGQKNFQTWSCGLSNRGGCQADKNASKIVILGSN